MEITHRRQSRNYFDLICVVAMMAQEYIVFFGGLVAFDNGEGGWERKLFLRP